MDLRRFFPVKSTSYFWTVTQLPVGIEVNEQKDVRKPKDEVVGFLRTVVDFIRDDITLHTLNLHTQLLQMSRYDQPARMVLD